MRWKLLLAVFLVVTFIAIGSLGCAGGDYVTPSTPQIQAWGSVFSQQNTGIWVTGEGKVRVVPDVAILSLGVEAQETTVAEAQTKAATAMTAIVAELDNFEIDRKDIQTQHFSITAVRRWVEDKGEEVLVGYRVTNTVTAKIR